MVKKKVKKKAKKKAKKKEQKPIPQHVLSLMLKVRSQLDELSKPIWIRKTKEVEPPTVEEYKRLDPYWLSTMTGRFAGRVLGELR